MRIRTQFIVTMLLFVIILVFLAASAIITHQKIEKASQQEDLASTIAQGASELGYLSNDYLIYRESQQLKRWQSRLASFSNQVAGLNVEKPEQQVLVRNIKANEQRLEQVFDSVASAVGGPSQNRSTALDLAFLQVSWSRMAVQSQGLVSDASRLSQLLHQQMDQLTETRTVLIYVMVGMFGVFLLVSYMQTYRRILKSIVTLQAGAAVIGSGNLDFKIQEKKNDEIGDLSHAFNQMTANLKDVTSSESKLEREIVERKQAEEALRQRTFELQHLTETLEQRVQERAADLARANETLRNLSSRLLSAQEEERKRIAGEIHDSLGSCLSGIKFKVEKTLKGIEETPDATTESLNAVIPVIQEGIEECRRMQQDLRPSLLDDLGLLATLSWFCRRYQTIYTGIEVELEQTVEEADIPNALKIVIFRVTQEGMNNIAKHSKADLVNLRLSKMNGRIELVLEDNGQGFDLKKVLGSESTKKGLGLTSMRERTELSGGSFAIESSAGKGTIICVSWPSELVLQ
jgi:signal transduction histidine kinase